MIVEKITATAATVTITADEMFILNNALNETLEALASNEDEFKIRVGVSVQEVKDLLDIVGSLVDQMD